jgi:hypothetical protein
MDDPTHSSGETAQAEADLRARIAKLLAERGGFGRPSQLVNEGDDEQLSMDQEA